MSDRDELPRGWRLAPLSGLCEIQPAGTTLKPLASFEPGAVPLIRPSDLREHRVTPSAIRYVDARRAGGLARLTTRAGDILVTRTGTVGRIALITEAEAGWVYNTHLLCLRPADAVSAPYLAGFLAGPGAQTWINGHASGSAIRSITSATLRGLPVTLPPLGEQRRIGTVLEALDEKIRAHEEIARTTGLLRESLASLLMSGKVPVPPE
ncbi:type I restriction enzyme, S subunit [Streptomyces sp. LaPpAH-199]|uniref:restriction endonuclease subunit S n=1 Tax=Streptomyces TaxID=1883 RepID=UPI00089198B8|nr:restriction endonuclease subunit S [Streptomyces sp. LaPpAH-199]MYW82708.1 N-6 DNA methylase [Streptomyces sp. SID8369]SDD93826.1 type I restriction enzyme, S subunit [Streptomyces sp. LaPpAH-199]